jgi:hemerythrin-like domain-containing protein
MLPIGCLMVEHRVIERMICLMDAQQVKIHYAGQIDTEFIDIASDVLSTYVDKCHREKEEDILFRALAGKEISEEHRKIMNQLVGEHVWASEKVEQLVAAKKRYAQVGQSALSEIALHMKELVAFYRAHIEKEDRHFFVPSMSYLSETERADMGHQFWDFDQGLAHEKYKRMVEQLERHNGLRPEHKPVNGMANLAALFVK